MRTCKDCGLRTDCPDHATRCEGRWKAEAWGRLMAQNAACDELIAKAMSATDPEEQARAKLTPLTPAVPAPSFSAMAAAIVRAWPELRAVEVANDAFVALGRFDRSEAATVVEERE